MYTYIHVRTYLCIYIYMHVCEDADLPPAVLEVIIRFLEHGILNIIREIHIVGHG